MENIDGVIYSNWQTNSSDEKKLRLLKWINRLVIALFSMGIVLILLILLPFFSSKLNFGKKVENKEKDDFNLILAMPTATPDLATLPFSIKIEKLGVEAKVFPNINANKESDYEEALTNGVAHGKGSAFPGQGKMVYIFGHSTDFTFDLGLFSTYFYNLNDLVEGDKVILKLGDDEFSYEVNHKEIIERTDTEFVNSRMEEDVLILQSCYPPTTSWKRLVIVAKPIYSETNQDKYKLKKTDGFADLLE